jgi:hypothetical protein
MPMADLFVTLLHYPMYDKNGAVVTTAVTNMDVHDIGRLSRTFAVRGFFVCTPVETLRRLVARIMRHWDVGAGASYNATRREALALVRQAPDLDAVLADIERETGVLPKIVVTTAKDGPGRIGFAAMGERLREPGPPYLLVFGTGWGLHQSILDRADFTLEPVRGSGEYNHLSVRAAAAIILDRLRNAR